MVTNDPSNASHAVSSKTPGTHLSNSATSVWRRGVIGFGILLLVAAALYYIGLVTPSLVLLLFLISVVGFWLCLAMWIGDVAERKGRSRSGFIALGLLVPLIAAVVVAAIAPTQRADVAASLNMGEVKVCPRCAETVKTAAVKCRFCGYDFPGGPVDTDGA